MYGLMMDLPLLVSDLVRHADRHHGDTELVSRSVAGAIERSNYAALHRRARRLASALEARGVSPHERVATLAWNSTRHLEVYYAASGMGAVIHTINPRLFPEQIAYIGGHAEDVVVFFDASFIGLVERLAPQWPLVRSYVLLGPPEDLPRAVNIPNLISYEELLAEGGEAAPWPSFDERRACSLCYTSGTTGHPKGVLTTHRSTILHAYANALPDAFGISARDVVLPIVPMFHASAWGLPYACPLVGAKMVMPSLHLDGKSLYELFEGEGVTMSAGVPTVWLGLLNFLREQGLRLTTLKRVIIGGSACPPSMLKIFREEYGVEVRHAWGMTEMSPLGTVSTLKAQHLAIDEAGRDAVRQKQGRVLYGVDMKLLGPGGLELPRDGRAAGDLWVRGPWICKGYFKGEGGDPLRDGWFPTGDVATIDADGFMQITDRSKDVIKSGGEWISSIELENIAVAHPAIAEAAVIGRPHPKWGERPVLVAVRRLGHDLTSAELLAWYDGKVVAWMVPDEVVFVRELPHTATGKLSKLELRRQFDEGRVPRT